MVAHEQRHPVTGLQTCRLKLASQLPAALSPLRVRGHNLGAAENGGPLGGHAGLTLQQMGEVQFNVSSSQARRSSKRKSGPMRSTA